MQYSQKSEASKRVALIARDRQGRRCADCGEPGRALKTRGRLVDGRRSTEWVCTVGCGQEVLTPAQLDAAVLQLAAADPSLVLMVDARSELQPVAPKRGPGRPRHFAKISDYAQARRRAVERLSGRPSKALILAALGLANGTFFRYERLLDDARRERRTHTRTHTGG